MPLGVVRTKSRSIWDDITPFVEKLVAAYKQSQQTKADNELVLSWVNDLEKAMKPQEVKSLLEIQEQIKNNINVESFEKEFVPQAMGLLQQKEIMTGGLEQPGLHKVEKATKTMQIVPVKNEWDMLYKFVSEIPIGGLSTEDFKPTLDIFKKQLESGRAMGTAAQQFLSMIMGESMPVNQRQKVEQDVGFAKELQSILFEKEFDEEAFYQAHPEMELKGFTSTGHKTYGKRAGEEKVFDFETFLKENKDWEIKSINTKGDVTVGRRSTTKKYDFATWNEAQQWTKAHPQSGFDWKIDPQPEGFNVTAVKKTPAPEGTKKLIPTYGTINSINEGLMNPDRDYDTELHNAQIKYNLEGVKLASKADRAENIYNMFERVIIGEEYIDEEGFIKDEEVYRDYYNDYERYAKVYFEETGEILPKKYLSIEEAGKYTSLTYGKGYKGGNKPVRNEENISWSWQVSIDPTQALFNQMQRNGLTPQDYDLDLLAKEQGIDVPRLLKMFNQ